MVKDGNTNSAMLLRSVPIMKIYVIVFPSGSKSGQCDASINALQVPESSSYKCGKGGASCRVILFYRVIVPSSLRTTEFWVENACGVKCKFLAAGIDDIRTCRQ